MAAGERATQRLALLIDKQTPLRGSEVVLGAHESLHARAACRQAAHKDCAH